MPLVKPFLICWQGPIGISPWTLAGYGVVLLIMLKVVPRQTRPRYRQAWVSPRGW